MMPIDLHPNLAPACTLVSFHCLTLYRHNQTANNWIFVVLIKHRWGRWMEGPSVLFTLIKSVSFLSGCVEENVVFQL